ncbi:MAG: hypothetical protein ABEI78_00530, partial [Candidatus Nanohaloarchaea archaeon]
GQQKFQAAQNILAYALSIIEAFGYVISGTFGNVAGDPVLIAILTSQIAVGGWLIILMDDLVQKWGFGSGTGLFISAGVSKAIFITLISPLTRGGTLWFLSNGTPVGQFFKFMLTFQFRTLVPVISTIVVFLTVVYLQAMRVEIPLTFGNTRGFGQKWPLKFLYTSNMPVILIAALVSNIHLEEDAQFLDASKTDQHTQV